MATAAQILANTRNAARSTGPRTVKGKSIVRGNALKHGRDALTLVPGLEHEDAKEVKQRVARYLDDWQPRTDAELDLVCQAARLSLAIERAERMEIAHMEGRIRAATKDRSQEVQPRRLEEVQELGRRLLYIAALDEIKVPRKPLWSDDPRLLVAKLEETADGCRWLLARWAEFRHLLDSRTHWELPVLLRFIRLQGKVVDESVFDPALNAIFLAWDVIIPEFAKHYWEKFRDNPCQAQTACLSQLRWREIAPRPSDTDEAWKSLDAIVDRQSERLEALLTRNKDMEREEPAGWTDRAALDLSPEFERHRRYLSAKTREFHRTLDVLRKTRESEGGRTERERQKEEGKTEMAEGTCQMADDTCQMADDACQMAEDTCQMADDACQMAEDTCQTAEDTCQMAEDTCQMAEDTCQMAEDTCQMVEGTYQMAEDTCQMVEGTDQMVEDTCQMAEDTCQMAEHTCQMAIDIMEGFAEVSIPETTGDEASAPAQEVVQEPAQREQLDDDAQGSEGVEARPENVQNKANLKSREVDFNTELTSRTASLEQTEQTQSPRPPDSDPNGPPRARRHEPVTKSVQRSVFLPGPHVDLDPNRHRDSDSDVLDNAQDWCKRQCPATGSSAGHPLSQA